MLAVFSKVLASGILLCGSHYKAFAGEITVSAAASLTDAFKDIAAAFETKEPKIKVSLNFAASGALLQQLSKGAPVDVVAFADLETMDRAESEGLVVSTDRSIFARNSLVVISPEGSTVPIKNLIDLSKAGTKRIAIGNPAIVPAGRYAKRVLQTEKIWESVAAKFIQTQSVRQALDYVARGEVDAAIVFATDAEIFKDKVRIAFALASTKAVDIKYPIAVTAGSRRQMESKKFVNFVSSNQGQIILSRFGFKKP